MKKIKKENKIKKIYLILFFIFIFFLMIASMIYIYESYKNRSIEIFLGILNVPQKNNDLELKLLFTGDIFFGRYLDKFAMASKTALYSYPFLGLNTLEKDAYDAWIGNLECPVTEKQATLKESETILRLSCKPEYLPELAKYFDILSLANNHTDNIDARRGIEETRTRLKENGMEYFGDYDNSVTEEVCKIIYINKNSTEFPIAFCGYHGVFKLPTDKELSIIKEYSKYFVTVVMPHQGEEYKNFSNTYQKLIYRKMIDNGADLVVGAHPHTVQEVEEYKEKIIFYSLGNFIFDQRSEITRRHIVIESDLFIKEYNGNYDNLNCTNISSLDCLKLASSTQILKPVFSLKYKPIFTFANPDSITKKQILTDKEYEAKLRQIRFDKIASSSKIQ